MKLMRLDVLWRFERVGAKGSNAGRGGRQSSLGKGVSPRCCWRAKGTPHFELYTDVTILTGKYQCFIRKVCRQNGMGAQVNKERAGLK